MSDLSAVIEVSTDASGVESGMAVAKKSIAGFKGAVIDAGGAASTALNKSGDGGKFAAKKIEDATKNIVGSIQRQIAATEAGAKSGADYYRALANQRGIDTNVLKPYLDQLDAAQVKATAATAANTDLASSVRSVVGFLGALGAVVSVGGFVAYIKSATDAGDAFTKLSQKSGVAVTALRELNFAASLSDVTTEALGVGLRKLSQNMAEAAKGTKEQSAAFAAIGVSVKGLDGNLKGADVALSEIASKFANFKDGPEKAALAIELFGKQGADLIPLLNAGSSGLSEMAKEANALGVVFGDKFAKNAEAFNDNLTRIAASSEGAKIALANELIPTLNSLAESFIKAKDGSSSFATNIGGFVRTIVEAATILYADVAFVLKGVGREIGAIGAQIAALNKFDIRGFTAISDAVKEDGVRARKELDRFKFDLLNSGILTSKAGAGRGTAADPRIIGDTRTTAPIVPGAGSAKAVDGLKAEQSAYESLIASIRTKIETDKAELAGGKPLEESQKIRIKLDQELVSGKLKLTAAHKAVAIAALGELAAVERQKQIANGAKIYEAERLKTSEEITAAYVAESKAREQGGLAVYDYVKAIEDQNAQTQFEVSLSGQTAAAREIAIRQYRIELDLKKQIDAIDKNSGFNEEQREVQRVRVRAAAAKASAAAESSVYLDEWKKTTEAIESSLTDALLRGFESGKDFAKNLRDTVVNMFKTMVLRPIIQATVQGGLNAVGLGSTMAGQSGGAMGLASNLSSAYSGISSLVSVGSQVVAGTMSVANALGTVAANATGTGISGLLATNGAFGTAAAGSASALAGGASAALAAIGPVGWAALAAAAALAAFGIFKKDKVGSANTGNATASFSNTGSMTEYQTNFGGSSKAVDDTLTALNQSYANAALALGIKRVDTQFATGGYATPGKDDAKFRTFARGGSSTFDSGEVKSTPEAMQLAVSRAVLAALKGSDLPRYLTGIFDSIDVSTASQEQITNVLAYAGALKTLDATFLTFPMESLKNQSFEAVRGLITFSGGIEAFTANLSSYYDNFYSAEEKRAQSVKNITATLSGAGLSLSEGDVGTATRAQFRAYAEALDVTTEAGQRGYAALMTVAGAFAQITPEVAAVTAGIAGLSDTLKNLLKDRTGLEADLLQAQGNTSGANAARRTIAIANFDSASVAAYDFNQALVAQITALNEAKSALDASAQAEVNRIESIAQAEKSRAEFVASERKGLQDQLNGLTDTSEQALTRQREALDGSNRALFDQVQAATAAKDALQLANAAADALAQSLRNFASDRSALEADLLDANGNSSGAAAARRAVAIAGLNDAQVAAFDYNEALRGQIKAVNDAKSAIDAATQAQEAATQAAKTSRADALALVSGAVDAAYGQVVRAADAQRKALTTVYEKQASDMRGQLDTVGQAMGKLQNLGGKLKSTLDGLKIAGSEGASRTSAQQTIAQLLATAKSGGGLPLDSRALDNALSAVSQPSEQLFGSFTDYARDFYKTANDISALNELTEKGLTEQQAMQSVLEAQLVIAKASYDSQLSILDAQLVAAEALAKNTTAVMTTADALALLNITIGNLNGVKAGQAGTVAPLGAAERADVAALTSYNAGVNGTNQNIEIYRLAVQKGLKADQVDTLMGYAPGTAADFIKLNGLPMLDNGTNKVPEDGAYFLHKNESVQPVAYNPALGGGDQGDMVAELRAMRAELEQLRASNERGNENTQRTANILDGQQGVPLLVEIAK